MRIRSLIPESCVLEAIEVSDKWELLRRISLLLAKESGLKPEKIESALVEREKLGSTALGEGVALPHARLPLLSRIFIGVVRSLKGIDFEAPDGQPVKIVFTVLAPEEETSAYIRCLSNLARMLRDRNFREAFLSARDKKEILEIILRFDREF